uniref:Large ribosomal subunit protein uL4c n=1 Tax=Ananas comosus var. bracteatus TaxID=296719 RepID=A0A6V7QTB0_ANACO
MSFSPDSLAVRSVLRSSPFSFPFPVSQNPIRCRSQRHLLPSPFVVVVVVIVVVLLLLLLPLPPRLSPPHPAQIPSALLPALQGSRAPRRPLGARDPPGALLLGREGGRGGARSAVGASRHRPRRRPPGPRHRPPEQAARHGLHPDPRRGARRRQEALPQKKTGRARLGSQRTPLRPGGGVVFGPKPRDWSIKINRKEKRLAISTALASAAAAADALVVEDFEDQFAGGPKTKDFVAAMRRWGSTPSRRPRSS